MLVRLRDPSAAEQYRVGEELPISAFVDPRYGPCAKTERGTRILQDGDWIVSHDLVNRVYSDAHFKELFVEEST